MTAPLLILVAISATFGMIGSLFVIVSFAVFRHLKHHRQRLVLFLAISDLFDSVAWFLAPWAAENSTLCIIQAANIQMFGFAGLFWNMFLGVHLLRVAFSDLRPGQRLNVLWWELTYHIIAWGFPAFMTIFLWTNGHFGVSGPNGCWIKSASDSYRIYFGYLIVFVTFTWNLVASLTVIRRMKAEIKYLPQSATRGNVAARHRVQRRLLAYCIAFGFVWVWGLINRILAYINPKLEQEWMFWLQGGLEPIIPMINAIIFGYSEKLRRMYADKFPTLCACCVGGRKHVHHRHSHHANHDGIEKLQTRLKRAAQQSDAAPGHELNQQLLP